MATHSSILAWRIPWKKELGGLQSMGSQDLDTTDHRAHTRIHVAKETLLSGDNHQPLPPRNRNSGRSPF